MRTIIYTLEHPTTKEIRYIDQTSKELSIRLSQHCSKSKSNHGTHKRNWIRKLLKQGLKPVIKELDVCEEDDYYMIEQYWIKQFKVWGFNLVNSTDGGPGTLGRKVPKDEIRGRSVVVYDKEGYIKSVYNTMSEAGRDLDIFPANIAKIIYGEKSSAGGYQFIEYLGETIIIDKIEPIGHNYKKSKACLSI